MHRYMSARPDSTLLVALIIVGLASGTAAAGIVDCNGNGVADDIDIANGDSQDCNGNGVPDECDIDTTFRVSSDTFSPFGTGLPGMLMLNDVPTAVGSVSFEITASGDLSSPGFEFISIVVNGTSLGDAFTEIGSDCAEPAEVDTVIVSPDAFNQAVGDFGGMAVIEFIAAADVNPELCVPQSFASLFVSFETGAGPVSMDCNDNGVPDECDLLDGTSQDCNGTGIPDECEVDVQVLVESGTLQPFDTANPQSFTILAPPVALSDVTITLTAMGDLDSSGEIANVDINGAIFGPVFNVGGPSCSFEAQDTLVVSAEDFNTVIDGFVETVITVMPGGGVGSCSGSFVAVSVSYLGAGSVPDCNSNGVPDVCDVGTFSLDCNDNLIPDECEPDCNGNGVPDDCDVLQGLPDCNGNGVPDDCDAFDPLLDCNMNGILDACGLLDGTETDCNGNGAPDECDIGPAEVDLEQVLPDLMATAPDMAALVPDRFDFSGGESGASISDGGFDMYDNGNFLNTNLFSSIQYTGSNVVASDAQFGPGSTYLTHKDAGIFIMAAVDISISFFSISGGLGADGAGTADGFQFTATVNANPFSVFVKRVYNTSDPSVNHIIIVPGPSAGLTQTFSSNTNSDMHQIDGLSGRTEVYYILVARRTNIGVPLDESDAMAIVDEFLPLVATGISSDCNGNMIPDECDLLDGSAQDCDGNGLPDTCDVDCDGNGTPDACEIAGGTAEDCNGNGRPDSCDLVGAFYTADSGAMSPLGVGVPQTYYIPQPPQAIDDVRLIFTARADLSSSSAFVTVDLNGIIVGDIFQFGASGCQSFPDTTTLTVDADTYNDAFGEGGLEIMMTPSPAVDVLCADGTFIQVQVEYDSAGLDSDGNGILDPCEACDADLNQDMEVGTSDFLLLLAQWGECPPLCLADLDGDNAVTVFDLLLLLEAWGPCP